MRGNYTRAGTALAMVLAGGLLLTACGSSSTSSESSAAAPASAAATTAASAAASAGAGSAAAAGEEVGVTLILKDLINPFFLSMQKDAEAQAAKDNVNLTVVAGKKDGDEATQIAEIENAIVRGDQGILILPSGPGVYPAIVKAREAGVYVIALDTPPDPADTVDITFATDNFQAGNLIGQWAAGTLKGNDVTIAMLDLFNDRVLKTDVGRDQGFLTGMGIDTADINKNADEAPTGTYSGGNYTIACQEPTDGNEDGGRTAMENCLAKNPDINLVYTINEPAGNGAFAALKAAGKEQGVTIVSVDGGCKGVDLVKQGVLGATSQQYPGRMATMGVDAIAALVREGTKPTVTEGLDFFNTGTALVTDKPVDGVESIDTTEAASICWG